MSSCSELINEPKAKKETHKIEKHNHVRTDNYYWMRLTDEQKTKKPYDQETRVVLDYINKENDMQKEKVKKISKKALIAEIEKMGVDSKITASLARANIETIVWVKSLIKS